MPRWLAGCLLLACTLQGMAAVEVTADEAHQRVDVTIDGQPFTSYVWPSVLKKPVLFPLIASGGAGACVHFADVFEQARVDGALAASLFHRQIATISEVKEFLRHRGVTVRP